MKASGPQIGVDEQDVASFDIDRLLDWVYTVPFVTIVMAIVTAPLVVVATKISGDKLPEKRTWLAFTAAAVAVYFLKGDVKFSEPATPRPH